MMLASALPIKGAACCNPLMLQGKELAAAIQAAIEKKNAAPGAATYGSTALGRALGISQPSAHGLIQNGRLSKERYLKLVDAFADVVGPDHWGLPYTGAEHELLVCYRAAPAALQDAVMAALRKARADGQRAAELLLDLDGVQRDEANRDAA